MTATLQIPTWQQFAIDSVQVVLFTPGHEGFSTSRVVSTILRRFPERFDGDMQVMPLAGDAPAELPWIILQGARAREELHIHPARFDLLRSPTEGNGAATVEEFVRSSLEVAEYYVSETRAQVGRMALVVRRVCAHPQPAQTLIDRFCNEASRREPLNRSSTFEIHNHKKYQPAAEGIDYHINSWVRCKCGTLKLDSRPAILVIQDLNTLADDARDRRFEVAALRQYFDVAVSEANQVIRKYFPA